MELIKSYINKDIVDQTEDQFYDSCYNDFINDDFISELEWAMIITQGRMKQTHFMEGHPHITINHFDKCHLWGRSENELIDAKKYNFLQPFGKYQANPEIFPYVNFKVLMINEEYISLQKIRELTPEQKRGIIHSKTYKHIYEASTAIWDKYKESFYGDIEGYAVNPRFFKLEELAEDERKQKIWKNLFYPVSLVKGSFIPDSVMDAYVTRNTDWYNEWILNMWKTISMAYQVALTDYYNWMIYIKEYDNIGFIIPIDPIILSEIYKTSMMKFENRKAMLHFVKEHFRRKRKDINDDYTVFVNKYLRGENKFNYRGFCAEIIPPKYDLNRVKTKKKFIDI